MARYCVCPVVGTGKPRSPSLPAGDPYRVGGVEGLNHVAVIPTRPANPKRGAPRFTWALVLAAGVPTGPGVGLLPDLPLDLPLSAPDLASTQAVLAAKNVSTAGVVTVRGAVSALGRALEGPAFDERRMAVG